MSAGALVVGASQAGAELAVSLRAAGYTGPITLVGAEHHPPYQRPPLSKALLAGTAAAGSLQLRAPEVYQRHGIALILGERIGQLEWQSSGREPHGPGGAADGGTAGSGAAGSGLARTSSGRELRFDQLALATGARARRLAVPGAGYEGVCHLRDIDDALRLRDRLARSRRVVVVGAGFIGLETAAIAAAGGLDVTVVEAADRVMARAVAPAVSEFYHRAHRQRGVDLRLGNGVRAIHGNGRGVRAVELADGTALPADTVIVGVGIVPRTELAEQLGIDCAGGILVDSQARTSYPSIVAAGDCTVQSHPVSGLIRLESVPNAIAQARAAAATLAGQPSRPPEVPWFWSDQYDLKLQMAGLADGHDTVLTRGDPDSGRFSVLYYRQAALIAVHAVNQPADYLAGRAALARRASIPVEAAARTDLSLKQLLTSA